MKSQYLFIFTILLTLLSCTNENEKKSKSAQTPIRIGWQIPWATQGQLVQILMRTDILKNNAIDGSFIGRTYGPLLNELAMANSVDVVLTADQPAAVLFSKDKGWMAIGRLMYNRTLTYVPIKSPIKTMSDLKGKSIGVPIGAAAERVTALALKDVGLSKSDYNFINLGIREQLPLIQKYIDQPKWGNFDALSGFDPVPAILQAKAMVRPIHIGKVVSVVLMNKKFIKKYPDAPKQFMTSLAQAYIYFNKNTKESNDWFMQEAKLTDASQEACQIAASLEPNIGKRLLSNLKMGFTEEDFKVLQSAADFIAPKVKKSINMKDYVTNQYVPRK
jgi:sulfonate transport system substrate-binding protein